MLVHATQTEAAFNEYPFKHVEAVEAVAQRLAPVPQAVQVIGAVVD